MILVRRLSLQLLAVLWLLTGTPGWSQEQTTPQQQAEIEKQIEALNKKLSELRRTNGAAAATASQATPDGSLKPDWVKAFTWRSIGPAAMGGRITAIAAFDQDPSTYFVATASGGLLKTINNGITFEHQFDREATVSIGDVCVAPSNRDIVWVGTGEANPRNSVSYGDGVYKSTDGGRHWQNMGLKKSFQIGRITIHPKNPDIVYVGALGRLYGPSEERGLFKTTDGGKTWQKVLYVDERTGVIDMQMHPADPETLLVATYERQRDEFDTYRGDPPQAEGYDPYDPSKKYGPGSGLYKTTDGGKTFKKLAKGLPTCNLGRIGIDYYRKEPNTVFAVIESEKIGMGTPPKGQEGNEVYMGIAGEDADAGAKLKEVLPASAAAKAGLKAGDIILSVENKTVLSYNQLVEQIRTHKVGDKVTLKVARNRQGMDLVLTLEARPSQQPAAISPFGGSQVRPYSFWYGGQRENVQTQQGPDSFQYGGVYKSTDGGESWTRLNSVNPRPMYFSQVRVDPTDDKYLYVLGIQLYRSSDGGKTFRPDGGNGVHPDQHALWINPKDGRHMIVGCDGGFYATYDRMNHWDHLNHLAIGQFYHVAVDSRKPYYVYGGLQDNGSWGGPSRSLRQGGTINEDWISVFGGDGFVCRVDPHDPDLVYCEFQDGNMFRRNLRTGEVARLTPPAPPGSPVRLDWSKPVVLPVWMMPAPFLLPSTVLPPPHRFNWNTPFILSGHNPNIFYCAAERVFRSLKQGDDLRAISPELTRTKRGSGTALAESPRNPDVLYVGTDDGALWMTRDGGAKWTNLTDKVPLPGPRWVASIEASRFEDGRAYVVFDAHRSNDDEPYVYVTEDFGQTWKSLKANLPWGSTRVLREDVQNPNLLFLGTEFGIWVSVNRGEAWVKLNNNLPTVAVHEIAIHPTAGEIVAATHGRSLWVLDVTALRQMTADALKADAYLYEPNTVIRWRLEPERTSQYGSGSRRFLGQNPPRGAQIYYSLTKKADKVTLKIVDIAGKTVQEMPLRTDAGLHLAVWNLMRAVPATGQPGVAPARQQPQFQPTPTGMYRVVLTVDGKEYSQNVRVDPDPVVPTALATPVELPDPDADETEAKREKPERIYD